MWAALTDNEGRLYTNAVAPIASDPVMGGVATSPAGAAKITTVVSGNFVNGFMVNDVGQLVVAPGGVIADLWMGLPRTAAGALVIQADVVPAASDPFVAGIRVGPLGGVYTNTSAPP